VINQKGSISSDRSKSIGQKNCVQNSIMTDDQSQQNDQKSTISYQRKTATNYLKLLSINQFKSINQYRLISMFVSQF
jgi:hypothetical protein